MKPGAAGAELSGEGFRDVLGDFGALDLDELAAGSPKRRLPPFFLLLSLARLTALLVLLAFPLLGDLVSGGVTSRYCVFRRSSASISSCVRLATLPLDLAFRILS